MGKMIKKGTKGNAVNYTTRNQALKKLQIKLQQFRRLCILKGIHPREPKKKRQGQNKTYYHVKDINFLQYEPLLEKFREIRAYDKKVTRAKAKKQNDLAERLAKHRPGYRLDHLVKERYPSFMDALRDLDDPLTMCHLFATLPAEKRLNIPIKLVEQSRKLCLEFQAYVTRTHALRKTFVSVKGIYYQAEVLGQMVTWITPHALSQTLPEDVDYRVMVTFLEFYQTLLEFVNFKLYHSLGLQYPPVLDATKEQAAAGLNAVMHDIASSSGGVGLLAAPTPAANPDSATVKASEKRLNTLKDKMSHLEEGGAEGEEEEMEGEDEEDPEVSRMMEQERDEVPEDELCEKMFKGKKFFLAREVNRESLFFVLKSFGGEVGWDGPQSPFDDSDEDITHHVCDRPTQKHRFLSVEYVQPQWVYDCVNFQVMIPSDKYAPGAKPPPHVSPFVQDEEEGYLPDYAQYLQKLQAASKGIAAGAALAGAPVGPVKELTEEEQHEDDEAQYAKELAAEQAGVSYSQAKRKATELESDDEDEEDDEDEDEDEEDDEDDSEEAEEVAPKKPVLLKRADPKQAVKKQLSETEDGLMLDKMLPRKQQRLYEAMQIGKARKQARVDELTERKQMVDKKNKVKK
eukprot:CAMPEP_0198207012 /NCGR_PEP_ID=MMETSP1445-20131203/10507_1 /TAXON_ID=36898 /ORGANISM="Pyramimonas sp., Strain CCMP2087" /LENGTH=627 /DNA_ID=CAMNT_0043879893 /DNA_START=150 /DNA_END=2033 /DNA_ORIENTATION=-